MRILPSGDSTTHVGEREKYVSDKIYLHDFQFLKTQYVSRFSHFVYLPSLYGGIFCGIFHEYFPGLSFQSPYWDFCVAYSS